jgi:hypothetical protein
LADSDPPAYEGLHTLHELGRRRAVKAKLEECESRNP